MRKLFAAVLALCLVFAFAMPAAAADVKFSGAYYVGGAYWDSYDVRKDNKTSQDFYYSKMRLGINIDIEEGVGIYMRGDTWDNHRWGQAEASSDRDFDFDYVYAWMNTGIGKFTMGQMVGGTYGLDFANNWRRADKIQYEIPFGNFGLALVYEKDTDDSANSLEADADADYYYLVGSYKWDAGKAGVLFQYYRDSTNSAAPFSVKTNAYGINPYMVANFGPVNVEAEVAKMFGNEQEYEDGLTTADVSLTGWAAYAQAKMNFGPAYAGAFVAYVSGDDPNTADENELGATSTDYDFGYILFNDEDWRDYSGATITAHGAGISKNFGDTNNDGVMGYGLIGGISPTKALSVTAALVTAKADENNAGYVDDDFGIEFDLGASYKLFSSVTYDVRFGYLWTGDYWKGAAAANQVEDIWMADHRISWKF